MYTADYRNIHSVDEVLCLYVCVCVWRMKYFSLPLLDSEVLLSSSYAIIILALFLWSSYCMIDCFLLVQPINWLFQCTE